MIFLYRGFCWSRQIFLPVFSVALPEKEERCVSVLRGLDLELGWGGGAGLRGMVGKGRAEGGHESSKLQDSHQLGAGAVKPGPDHFQAGDVPGVNPRSGLEAHALQILLSTFRVHCGRDEGGGE